MNNDNWKNFNIDEELKTNNQEKKGVFSYKIKVLILLLLWVLKLYLLQNLIVFYRNHYQKT